MALADHARGLRPETRAALFHATVYLSHAAAAVFFGIWLSQKGISSDEIGIINAVPVVILLATNLFIGRIADRASDWRSAIVIMALLAGVTPIALFFVDDFWGILLVWTLVMIPTGSIPPVIDAATVRLTQRNGTDFGSVRGWGTIGYMAASALTGLLIGWLGADAFLPIYLVLSLMRAALALQLPRFRAPGHVATSADGQPRANRLRPVLKPWFVLPLAGFALVNATHALLVVFAALVWQEQGIAPELIGPLFAVGAGAEAAAMFLWRRVGGRFSARQMILAACLTVVVRWTIMAFSPPVAVLFGLQLLHSITYAVGYFGVVHFIANWTSEEIAAEAQGFSFVLQQVATVVALVGFGAVVGQLGAWAFLIAAALGLIGAVCVAISLRIRPAKASVLAAEGS